MNTRMAIPMPTEGSLLALMQLCSASLPVGGYAFSHGMEYAIEAGWIHHADDVANWLQQQLTQSLAQTDLPALRLSLAALASDDVAQLAALNAQVLACRETKELRLTDTAMGDAMRRLFSTWTIPLPASLQSETALSFVILFALACHHWQINTPAALQGFGWSWLENQVAAATKLVPLGQSQAQQLLLQLSPDILAAIDIAADIAHGDMGAGLPALAIASCQHETQYSRLFRS